MLELFVREIFSEYECWAPRLAFSRIRPDTDYICSVQLDVLFINKDYVIVQRTERFNLVSFDSFATQKRSRHANCIETNDGRTSVCRAKFCNGKKMQANAGG